MNYHEMISATGEGAAHPGGFRGTLDFLEDIGLSANQPLRILEVGCGTGRTACLLAKKGARVTAMDQSTAMLDKAKWRAQLEHTHLDFIQGDICSIPLDSEAFDVVLAESVTIFARPAQAYREYYRVLQKGGTVWDRELCQIKADPHSGLKDEMRKLYGNSDLPNQEQWMEMMSKAGFREVYRWKPKGDSPFPSILDRGADYDPYRFIDFDALQNPDFLAFTEQNEAFLHQYHDHISYGVFIGTK